MLRKKRGRGERRNRRWRKDKDDHFWSDRKEKREVKRRKRQVEEEMLEKLFPILEDGSIVEKKQSIFRRFEYVLSAVRSARKDGPSNKKQNADFSACIGYTSNTIGLNGFKMPHNLWERRHLGIHVFRPENRRAPWWLLESWRLSKLLIPLYDASFGDGNFLFVSSFLFKAMVRVLCTRGKDH